MSLVRNYAEQGFLHLAGFFECGEVTRIREEAKEVFLRQMRHRGYLPAARPTEAEFEAAMARFFQADFTSFTNCGKVCQHLVSLHRLALAPRLLGRLRELGVEVPTLCTRPVLYFNTRKLARSEVYYKTPPHQDWRSMQGSLNAVVVWVPLMDIDESLGALRIVPGSHRGGLYDSQPDEWYRSIPGLNPEEFVSVPVQTGDALFFSAFLVHASGDNVTDAIRWSCHFRYNDLADPTYVARGFPVPYTYKPQQELITPQFPQPELLRRLFS